MRFYISCFIHFVFQMRPGWRCFYLCVHSAGSWGSWIFRHWNEESILNVHIFFLFIHSCSWRKRQKRGGLFSEGEWCLILVWLGQVQEIALGPQLPKDGGLTSHTHFNTDLPCLFALLYSNSSHPSRVWPRGGWVSRKAVHFCGGHSMGGVCNQFKVSLETCLLVIGHHACSFATVPWRFWPSLRPVGPVMHATRRTVVRPSWDNREILGMSPDNSEFFLSSKYLSCGRMPFLLKRWTGVHNCLLFLRFYCTHTLCLIQKPCLERQPW